MENKTSNKKNKFIYVICSTLIGIVSILVLYILLIAFGVIQTRENILVIKSYDCVKVYDGLPLICDQWEIIEGSIRDDHRAEITIVGEQTDVGITNTELVIRIYDTSNAEVTSKYKIEFVSSKIEVTKRAIGLLTASETKIYDGLPLKNESYSILYGSIPKKQHLLIDNDIEIEKVGTVENFANFTFYDDLGRDVTNNYDIHTEFGTLTILPRSIIFSTPSRQKIYDGTVLRSNIWNIAGGSLAENHTVSPNFLSSITEVGIVENKVLFTIYDDLGRDVTNNYDIHTEFGTLTIFPRSINFSTSSKQKIYDGTVLRSNTWNITGGSLAENHTVSPNFLSSITEVGIIENKVLFTIYDNFGNDVSSNYEITIDNGVLEVLPISLTIQSDSAEKVYDGYKLTAPDSTLLYGKVLSNHILEIVSNGEIVNVGSVDNNCQAFIYDKNGNDVSHCYNINYLYGNLTVLPISISISTINAEKEYDGLYLEAPKWSLDSGYLIDGQSINVFDFKKVKNVGLYENTISYNITDKDGNDVSSNYIVNECFGYLYISQKMIIIETASDEKMYDGKALKKDEWEIIEGAVYGNDTLIVDVNGSITLPGSVENIASAYVIDGETMSASLNYFIQIFYGRLTVSKIESSDSIAKNPFESSEKTFMKLKADVNTTLYLRSKSKGNYDIYNWDEPVYYNTGTNINPLYLTSKALEETGKNINNVEVETLFDGVPFAIPNYVVDGPNGIYSDIYIDESFDDYSNFKFIVYEYNPNEIYTIKDPQYKQLEEDYRKFVYNNYLYVAPSTKNALIALAEENGLFASNENIILEVRDFVQGSAKYTKDFISIPSYADTVLFFLTVSKEGICQHFAAAATLMLRSLGIPARYVEGYSCAVNAGEWTELKEGHAWTEVYIDGMGWVVIDATAPSDDGEGNGNGTGSGNGNGFMPEDNIEERKITVKPNPVRVKYYEGLQPVYPKDIQIDGFEKFLELGYGYSYSLSGYNDKLGKTTIEIDSFNIYDENGVDVTDTFEIKYKTSYIHIYIDEIYVQTGSSKKLYDGTPLINHEWSYYGNLTNDHYLDISTVVFQKNPVDAGIVKNSISFVIRDSNNNDITDYYWIRNNFGELIIDPIFIEIQSGSSEKKYDKFPLENSSWEFVNGTNILESHSIYVECIGKQTNIGVSPNLIGEIIIENEYGIDVTKNYEIKVKYGLLIVKK